MSTAFDISKIGFSFVANFSTQAKAIAAAKAAGFGPGDVRGVYTRFTKAWIVGSWKCEQADGMPDHLHMLTKDGRRCPARITRGVSCVGTLNSLLLNI